MLSGIFGGVVGWKIWGIIGMGVMAYILKLRGDGYKHDAENSKAETKVTKAKSKVAQFEAINIEKANQAQKESDVTIDDDYTGSISI